LSANYPPLMYSNVLNATLTCTICMVGKVRLLSAGAAASFHLTSPVHRFEFMCAINPAAAALSI
jgi:hypothetical protein